MTDKQFQKAAKFIENNCSADDFSLFMYRSDETATRYAQNMITQNMTGVKYGVRLNVAYGTQTGSARINSLDECELKKMVETAQNIAKLNKPDPEFVPSTSKAKIPKTDNLSENTVKFSMKEMVDVIKKTVDNAEKKKAFVSGIVTKRVTDSYLKNKNGFEGFDSSSEFENSMTMADNKTREAKVERSVKDVNDYSIKKEIDQLNSRFDALTEPKKIEAGQYNVILRPQAVINFFSFLLYFFDRKNADYGVSAFHNSIGKNMFGKNFSLISSLDEKDLTASAFSGDGLAARNIDWIKNGVVKELFTNRSYAHKIKAEPNFIPNVIIRGGNATEEEMMKKVKNGLIINNFWYIRTVSMRKNEVTGLTRDGIYYFENGKIKHSVNNLRFNEVLHDAAKNILLLGKEDNIAAGTKVPTMLIKDFTFADTTSF
ncbi:MAG TPA: TldD/PmbA family protein [Clostridiales bacterium]|nr:TldD/PmbA family protein [Clostridiales bacterium]HQP70438.1 TldD/PmbA family protein [Clostridiales bacterium]